MDREDDEGTGVVFWLASFEFTAASKTPVDLLFVWSDDNTEADVINTREAEDNRRNFWYGLYVRAVADPDKGGGRSSKTWDKGGARAQQNFFSAPRALVWSKSKEGLSPGSTTDWCPSWE